MTDACVGCGLRFSYSSKPLWAFDRAGQMVGRVHTSHSVPYLTISDSNIALEAARFTVWLMNIDPLPPQDSDEDFARSLGISEEPAWPMSTSQEARLAWWARPEGMHLSDDRLASIREAYRELVERYRAWRESIHDLVEA